MRSFFTTIADSLLEPKKVPKMDLGPDSSTSNSIKLGNYDSVRRSAGLAGLGRLSRNRGMHVEKSNNLGISVQADPWEPTAGKDDPKYDIKGITHQI